jgi:hypothetical protein
MKRVFIFPILVEWHPNVTQHLHSIMTRISSANALNTQTAQDNPVGQLLNANNLSGGSIGRANKQVRFLRKRTWRKKHLRNDWYTGVLRANTQLPAINDT